MRRPRGGVEWGVVGMTAFVIVAVVATVWYEAVFRMRCREAGGVAIRFSQGSDVICLNKGTPIDVWGKP